MNIHEYQARNMLEKHNIKFPKGKVGSTPKEIYNIAKSFGGKVVVKAQIHSGGRGKAGGVKICNSAIEAKEFSLYFVCLLLLFYCLLFNIQKTSHFLNE